MMEETVSCSNCGGPVKIGLDECQYCAFPFKERWDAARRSKDPNVSSDTLKLALLDAETCYVQMMNLYNLTQKRGKRLSKRSMRKYVLNVVAGSKEYRKYVAELVVDMIEGTIDTIEDGEREFRAALR